MKKLGLIAALLISLTGVLSAQNIDVAALNKLLDQLQATLEQIKTAVAAPTPPPAPTTQVRVAAGGNLQAALDVVQPGTTILVAPSTFTGNFVLRKKVGTGTIVIRTDTLDDAALPPTVRVSPAIAPRMARLRPSDIFTPVLRTEEGASGYVLIGMDVGGVAPDRDVVVIGDLSYTSTTQLPVNITLDRMYIHGDVNNRGHRGVMMNATNGTVINSYVNGFVEQGRDSQAIAVINTNGPTRIENNYLEATGENFLTGGADPKIPNAIPSDLIVRGNLIMKLPAWKTTARGSVKNLLELKLCKRCLIENNVLDGSWPDAQTGQAMLFTNRNQDGTAPWSTVQDVTVQYNVLKNIEGVCAEMLGLDEHLVGIVSIQGTNIIFRHNLGICGDGLRINNGYVPTIVEHNTFVKSNNWFIQFTNNPIPSGKFTFRSNIVTSGWYGIVGDGTGLGIPTLTIKAPNAVFTNNVIEKAPYFIAYPLQNYEVTGLAGRYDARKRYLGTELAHDGTKPGADIDGIIARIPWATW